MTKVLSIVSYPILPARTGGQKGIALFYKYFSAKISLVCVTTRKNDPASAEGYEVLNILSDAPARYGNLFYFFKLRKIIHDRKITHLLLEHPYYGWLGFLLKYFTGVKLIVHSHNIEGLRWKTLDKWWWKWMLRYEGWTHRRANYNFFKQPEDHAYGISHFRLDPDKCHLLTYGVEIERPVSAEERSAARQKLLSLHGIPVNHTLLLFNGAFNYAPNLNALYRLTRDINPILSQRDDFAYTLLICGKDIPQNLTDKSMPNTVITGFVDDITLYYKGADIFLNPLMEGGGIKTKLVEALGYGMNAVSTTDGAIGVDRSLTNGKLEIVSDYDNNEFAQAIIKLTKITTTTPIAFFKYFYWGDIAGEAARFITFNQHA